MILAALVMTLLLCYSGAGVDTELDGKAKDILISRVQVDAYDTAAAELKRKEAAEKAAKEEVKVSEEVKELKEERKKSSEDIKESTTSIKKAYLTFDDGPSSNTDRILDILDEYNVKGNFFVIGRFSDAYKDQYRRIIDEGHVIGMHSYSHIYTEIYASADAFTADLNHVQYVIYDVTGYAPNIYRFPGGSSNLVSPVSMLEFIDILDKRGIVYYDWNVNSGDADTSLLGKQQIIDNVFTGIKALDSPEERNEVMILFHDLAQKTTTVEALPAVIEGLQAQGYVIAPIDDYTKKIQYPNVE
ncbi:MAG: polysaccharide deacetylase [Lachnospiraceae bacterium]|nr:polysaccharide deacetylase [Lachnospiraceae bacterium]